MGIKCIIFVGNEVTKTFLFECAKFWAAFGKSVYYISHFQHQSLPTSIQGTNLASNVYLFRNMTFITLPSSRDLLCYLYSLQDCARIPKMIILEHLEGYCNNFDSTDVQFPKICAALKDAVGYCSSVHNDELVYLILSLSNIPKHIQHVIDVILTPTRIWNLTEEGNDLDHKIILETNNSFSTDGNLKLSFSTNDKNSMRLDTIQEILEFD